MKAINLKNAYWNDNGRKATFQSQRPGFGIQRDDGRVISSDGVSPAVWDTKRVVTEMLPYADDFRGYNWISINH